MTEAEARNLAQQINETYTGRLEATFDASHARKDGTYYRVKVLLQVGQRIEYINYLDQWKGLLEAWSYFLEPHKVEELEIREMRARTLLGQLSYYKAVIRRPHACGCVLFAQVEGGYRCLRCTPPATMSMELRQQVQQVCK